MTLDNYIISCSYLIDDVLPTGVPAENDVIR